MIFPPKIMVIGHARHGKDTVAEYIARKYNLTYESSSHFAARKFIFDYMKDHYGYATVEECLEDRVNHRELWYNLISDYNLKNAAQLVEDLFLENDIYCGLRSKREFNCAKNRGAIDYTIWVDRSDHLLPEDKKSMNLEPWMADFIIDNNRTLEETYRNVGDLMDNLLSDYLDYRQ